MDRLEYELNQAKKARIKDITYYKYKDLNFILGKYTQPDINGNSRYYYRVLDKNYNNITGLFKGSGTFTRTYLYHASTNNPSQIIDYEFMEYIRLQSNNIGIIQ